MDLGKGSPFIWISVGVDILSSIFPLWHFAILKLGFVG